MAFSIVAVGIHMNEFQAQGLLRLRDFNDIRRTNFFSWETPSRCFLELSGRSNYHMVFYDGVNGPKLSTYLLTRLLGLGRFL